MTKNYFRVGKENYGLGAVNFRLRDAVFSRQRYWGEPIPIYYKSGVAFPLNEKNLPLILPKWRNISLPTSDGKPPLGNAKEWAWDEVNERVVSIEKINNKTIFPIELNTMPGWAEVPGILIAIWIPQNQSSFARKEAMEYWKEVDFYMGGSEHATGHLLYSRFWQKFLFDLGYLKFRRIRKKLVNQGMILEILLLFIEKKEQMNFFQKD